MAPSRPPRVSSAAIRRRAGAPEGTLRRRLATLRLIRAEVGRRGLLALAVGRLLRPPLGHLDWELVILNEHRPRPGAMPFRWAGFEDVGLLTAFGRTPAEIRRRLGRGDRCALVEEAGALVAYAWFVPHGTWDEDGLLVRLAPDQVWTYDVEVARAHRGRGISPHLRRAAVADLGRQGMPRAFSTIDRLNLASLRASAKSGRPVAGLLKVMVGPLGVVRIDDRRGRARWRVFLHALPARIP